ncbi:MAG: ATP-binding cassette domain-containing protein, partial [Rhodobacteraceae bacterium]
MSTPPGQPGKVIALTRDDHEPGAEDRSDLAVVAWLARARDRTFFAPAVAARLPRGADLTRPEVLARALQAVGLTSRLVLRDPGRLDPVVLPAVLFRKSGPPLILTALDARRKIATVVDPAQGGIETETRLRALRRDLEPGVLLVTTDEDGVARRLDPHTAAEGRRQGHWFWAAVRANRAAWAQVMVAALCLNILSLALPIFVMNVYDRVIPNLAFVTLWTLALGVAIALGLELLLRGLRAGLIERVGRRVDLKVASALFTQAMNVRLLNRPGGAAGIANTIRDFETVRDFFASSTVVAAIDLLFIGIFAAFLYVIVGPIALVPLLAVPVILILALVTQVPLARSAGQAQAIATKRHIVLVESLSGVETVKSLGAEPAMQREWEDAVAASSRVGGRTRLWSNLATNGTMLIQQAVSVIIIVWGVFLVSDGRISIGGLIAANILAGRILAPMGTIAQTVFRAQYAFKSLGALNAFMALPVEAGPTVASDLSVSHARVELRNVTLTYPGQKVPVLRDISLTIAPGEAVALLGRVGAGKTTLGKLIAGLIQPDAGAVLIDGVAQAQYDPAALRRGIGYLPQNPDIFTGTLRENLTLGAPAATDAQIARALYFAAMDRFVGELPDGLDTFLGERGARPSGGERQALAL